MWSYLAIVRNADSPSLSAKKLIRKAQTWSAIFTWTQSRNSLTAFLSAEGSVLLSWMIPSVKPLSVVFPQKDGYELKALWAAQKRGLSFEVQQNLQLESMTRPFWLTCTVSEALCLFPLQRCRTMLQRAQDGSQGFLSCFLDVAMADFGNKPCQLSTPWLFLLGSES